MVAYHGWFAAHPSNAWTHGSKLLLWRKVGHAGPNRVNQNASYHNVWVGRHDAWWFWWNQTQTSFGKFHSRHPSASALLNLQSFDLCPKLVKLDITEEAVSKRSVKWEVLYGLRNSYIMAASVERTADAIGRLAKKLKNDNPSSAANRALMTGRHIALDKTQFIFQRRSIATT